jgi:hypothetical protein
MNRHIADRIGRQHDRDHRPPRRHAAGEEQRRAEREQQFEMDHQQHDHHGVPEGAPEIGIGQDLGIVGEADEARRHAEAGFV